MSDATAAQDRPTAVVTGASAGIGKATARRLLESGWRVIVVGRDPQRCATAEAELRAAVPAAPVDVLRADFTSMAEVARIAREITALTPRLDVLINNAGGVRDRQVITDEGLEATFAANHLAPFLLTQALMPLLESTAGRRPAGAVRVISVSSSGHRMAAAGMSWDDLQSIHDYTGALAYCRAKLANILFTRELARRAAPSGIVAQSMHPGVVDSNFASHGDEAMQAHMAAARKVSPEEPAETLVWLAASAEGGERPGRYFHALAEETPSDAALDAAAAERLWRESEALLSTLGFPARRDLVG